MFTKNSEILQKLTKNKKYVSNEKTYKIFLKTCLKNIALSSKCWNSLNWAILFNFGKGGVSNMKESDEINKTLTKY